MSFAQGAESNFNGRWLENIVRDEARNRGVPIKDYYEDADNRDLFAPAVLICRVPYRSIYGCSSTGEFVLQWYERRIRIECRVQESSGSVDEKFPFMLINAEKHMPEPEVIFLMHGDGPRAAAMAWLRRECAGVTTKTIRVMNVSEYRKWFKELFRPPGVGVRR